MPLLNPGDPSPELTITTTEGEALALPGALGEAGVRVAALSVEDRETTAALDDVLGLARYLREHTPATA